MPFIGLVASRSLFIPLIFAVLLVVFASVAFVRETLPFLTSHSSPIVRFEALAILDRGSGLSIISYSFELNDCLEAIAGPTGMAQPNEPRAAVLKRCKSFAENAVASNPSFALAWFVAAYSSAELRQYDQFNFQLAAAQKTAPNEQWLAQFRVALAEDNLDRLSSEARADNDVDLKLLVRSRLGVASIAARYVTQPEFRERITSIVETLNNEEQRRFAGYVRAAARQATAQGTGTI